MFSKRVPDAELVGTAQLKDYKFDINTPCEYKGLGFGGIEYRKNSVVYGALYKISESSLKYLDILEWVPFHFYTRELKEVLIENKSCKAYCYITCFPKNDLLPTEGYINLIRKGASRMAFPECYLQYLNSFHTKTNAEIDNSFNLRNPGSRRIFDPRFYKFHDLIREKLCKII